jgi:hypothetical protein
MGRKDALDFLSESLVLRREPLNRPSPAWIRSRLGANCCESVWWRPGRDLGVLLQVAPVAAKESAEEAIKESTPKKVAETKVMAFAEGL